METAEIRLYRLSTRLITLMGLVSMAVYYWLPQYMAIHWDRWGHPDRFVHKTMGAFLIPALSIFVVDGLRLIDRLSPKGFEVARFQAAWDATLACIAGFFSVLHYMMLAVALGLALPVHRVVPASVGLLVMAIGFFLPQFKRNWWAGIRTPWTLASEAAWDETHRAAGPLWVTGGMVLALTGLFAASFPLLWVATWFALIGGTLYLAWSCRRE